MHHFLRSAFVCVVAAITCVSASGADNSKKALKTVLNNTGYSLIDPARTDIVPGGFVVANKKHASYNGLPPSLAFETTPFSATIYSSTSGGSFGLAAMVNGLAQIVGGGLKVDKSSTLTVKQVDASAQKIDPETVLSNPAVQNRLKQWLSDKNADYRVYIIENALTTKNISVTSTSAFDVAGAFGKDLPTCSAATSKANEPGPSTGSGTSAQSGKTSDSKSLGVATAVKGAEASTETSTASGGKSSAGDSLSKMAITGCVTKANNSEVGLSTQQPTVFAASLRSVTLSDGGKLSVSPVSDVQNTKAPDTTDPALSNIDWSSKRATPGFGAFLQ